MSGYVDRPLTLGGLFRQGVRNHFAVLSKVIVHIIFLVLSKDLYLYLGGLPSALVPRTLIIVVMTLLVVYFFAALLLTTDRVLRGEPLSLNDCYKYTAQRIGQLYLCCLFYVVSTVVVYFLAKWLLILVGHVFGGASWLSGYALTIIGGVSIMYVLVLSLYAFPIILLENKSLLPALRESAVMTIDHWWKVLGVFVIFFMIVILVSPDTLHGHLLNRYHVSALFDFIVFTVVLPLYAVMILAGLHDLKLRAKNVS